jgi:ABC-type polysaccharide/polyol phosphate export permease
MSDRLPTAPDEAVPGTPVRLHAARSRLRDPRRFLREWARDAAGSPPVAWRLFVRSLIEQYRHSSMGIFLAFAPVVLTALVFTFGRRSNLVAGEIGGVNSAFFGACGMLMGQGFLEAFNAARRLFSSNQALFRRQSVPIEGPLGAILLDLGFRYLIRLAVLALLMALLGVPPAVTLPLAAWGLLGLSLVAAGLGLLVAPPSALQQDFNVFSSALPLILFTITPVFMVPAPGSFLGRVHAANPLAWLFESVRAAAYGAPGSLTAAALGPLVGVLLLLLGGFICRIARPHVVERILV